MLKRLDLTDFLSTPEPPDLGPGPRTSIKSQAELETHLNPLLAGSALSQQRRQLVRALLLLWHDHLDAAHEIAQSIENPDGAFVHGIMHRREPDFSNAAYWFRRVGPHPAFDAIATCVTATFKSPNEQSLATMLVRGGTWDPFAFIDACEQASGNATPQQTLLRQIQRIETDSLLASLLS